MFRALEKRLGASFDWPLTFCMIALCAVGLVVLASAGHDAQLDESRAMERQAAAMGVGLLAFFGASIASSNFWKRWAYFAFAGGCLLLFAIDAFGVAAGGARRWLDLGPVRMQPSEFMKIGIILTFARLFSSEKSPEDGYTLKRLWLPAAILLVPVGLTLVQPDLGTALCQLLIGASMLLLVGVRSKTILTLALFGAVLAVPAWKSLHDYQQKRILNFLSPEMDPLGSGYHAIQSKIAVGSGAMFGKGFLKGTQTQLRFLPEQTTDFLFSVLAEEWGFVGSAFAVSLYIFLVYRILRVCMRADDRFQTFVCFGVASMIFWHVMVNIGMVTGILPVVGITLPLLSYGGSSVVTQMTALGLVARVSSRRYLFA